MFYTWHLITDPDTGWLASKTSGWTADSFSGGLEVDFSAVVPVGTKAVRVSLRNITDSGYVYWSKADDTANVSNTPNAATEYSHLAISIGAGATHVGAQCVVWLSADGKADFAVTDVDQDLYISYPSEVLM